MKKLFTVLLASLVSQFSFGQPPLDLEEDFSTNKMLWNVTSNKNYTTSIQDGNYTINNHPSDSTGQFIWRNLNVDVSRDFIVETKIQYVSGADDNTIALVWCSTNSWKNTNIFGFAANQYYKNGGYTEGKYVAKTSWTKNTSIVRPKGEYNVLKIYKKDAKVLFYVNDSLVQTSNFEGCDLGNYFGFYIGSYTKVNVDYFKIYQYGSTKINLIEKSENGYVKENLGTNINTKYSEKSPFISTDGRTMYFVRGSSEENIGYNTLKDDDDIYVSKKDEQGNWGKAVNIGRPINNESYNFVVYASPDENTLIVGNTYKSDGTPNGKGLSISNKTAEGWEIPKKIEMEDYYNRDRYVENSLSYNQKVLIMAVKRDDSFGGRDLYVSFKQDSVYSKPINMGNVINTKENEISPFLAADDKTLYFSSSGHSGYGSNDIFVTYRLDDTWLNWSEPKNLGSEINTNDWDAYFTVPASGDYAYLVSAENNEKTDLYRVKLPESAKPKPIMIVRGRILNAKTKEPIPATVVYEDPATGKAIGSALSDPITGNYQIALPSGVLYGFLAEKNDFYPTSDFLDLKSIKEYKEIVRDLYLKPIEKNETFRLNNLFFDTDKSNIRTESFAELNRLVQFLTKNPQITIQIEGYTDNQGNAEYNLNLSKNRAIAVVTYLKEKGISESRITSKGFGLNNPIAPNTTPEGRQQNRRVEFRITEK